MSLIKTLFNSPKAVKFTPASSEVDWQYVQTLVHGPGASDFTGQADFNSAVFACLMTIATSYPEPPLVVKRRYRSGDVEERTDHPLQQLLDNPTPNGELSIEEILFWTAWAKHVDGNAYWLKVRSGDNTTGNVIELWPISPNAMAPYTEPNSGDWISYYKYHIRPNETIKVPVENVIHFRLGIDDRDMRLGLSPLKALLREISTDSEADKFTQTLLKNYAVPGLVVVPAQGTVLNEGDAERIAQKLRYKFGGDNRGNIAVMSKESTISQFGFSPKDLEITSSHRLPEERISAVLGVPAIVAGLGAGLDRATYANFKEAREMFTENKLIPLWRADANKLTTSLLGDFSRTRNAFIEFDISDVRALQEDEDAKYNRLQVAVGKPFMSRNEARTDIGLDPVDGWDDEDFANEPEPEPVPEQLQDFTGQEALPSDENADTDEIVGSKALDLDRWRRKAVKAVKAGRSAVVKFESDAIPFEEQERIRRDLASCKTADDVCAVFADKDSLPILSVELKRANDLLEAIAIR